MTEERFPRRDFLKVTASTALTFGAALPATAQTSASAPSSDDPALDASSSQRQIPARSRRDVQHVHSRLDQLLRQLLSDTVASDPDEDRSLYHPLAAPQIQAVA